MRRRLVAPDRKGRPTTGRGTGTLRIARDIDTLRMTVNGWRRAGDSIGLVPTMGALHDGHLALVDAALGRCDHVVTTIFVNPTQFGAGEDFTSYPRAEAADAAALRARGVDLLFAPDAAEIYPDGFATTVHVGPVGEGLCGAHRPGHFDGVATVVAKLLQLSQPDVAFFGEKDYQQLMVVRQLVRDLDIPVAIAGIATVRDPDGLALSSRNRQLGPAERAVAPTLYRVLTATAERLAAGEAVAPATAWGKAALAQAGLSRIEYLEARDAATLAPIERLSAPARVLAAAWLGRTRLIDNVPVSPAKPSRPA